MHKVSLNYEIAREAADDAAGDLHGDLHHPLVALLDAVHGTGSISAAARELRLSYRHVWGELRRWEAELGRPLVHWTKGQPAVLSSFGEKLLWAERRARARLAPQIDALRSELELAFAIAFDDSAGLIPMHASHDEALPRLRELCQAQHKLLLDIQFTSSVEALGALRDGRCLLAGFHALEAAPRGSPTASTYRALLKPGRHKLIGFVRRMQELLRAAGMPALAADAPVEVSHRAVAAAVASGSTDVGFGIEAAARAAGLDFIGLARERYFLVTLAPHLEDPRVQALRRVLQAPPWLQALAAIPGHAPDESGHVLSLRRVLPWWTYRRPKA